MLSWIWRELGFASITSKCLMKTECNVVERRGCIVGRVRHSNF
jgi:hypothetical protein